MLPAFNRPSAPNRTCSPRPFLVFSRSRSFSSFSISCSVSKSAWPAKAHLTSANPKRACWRAIKTRSLSATSLELKKPRMKCRSWSNFC
ncbi:MAG: hypothetical protein DME43_09380, partial [Verrucomicrobia bacterium]